MSRLPLQFRSHIIIDGAGCPTNQRVTVRAGGITREEASAVINSSSEPWVGPEGEIESVDRLHSLESLLQLTDRIKSLEAELTQVSTTRALTPTEQLDAEQQLIAMRASPPWRVGRVVTIPLRIVQRMLRRNANQ